MQEFDNEFIHIVLDTNVLVSALITKDENSPIVKIVSNIFQDNTRLKVYYCAEIINEYKHVLAREKFNFNKSVIEKLVNSISHLGCKINRLESGLQLKDLSDLPFYETLLAINEKSSYLITGNTKHFPNDNRVLTPREFWELLNKIA